MHGALVGLLGDIIPTPAPTIWVHSGGCHIQHRMILISPCSSIIFLKIGHYEEATIQSSLFLIGHCEHDLHAVSSGSNHFRVWYKTFPPAKPTPEVVFMF